MAWCGAFAILSADVEHAAGAGLRCGSPRGALTLILNASSHVRIAVGLLLAGWGFACGAAAQPVQGDVKTLGFEAGGQIRNQLRLGQWTPILLELTAPGSEVQEVTLRLQSVDMDGDQIAYDAHNVIVTGGAGIRRYWMYASFIKEMDRRQTHISVIRDGAELTRINIPQFDVIGNDSRVVLDVSETLVPMAAIDSKSYYDPGWGSRNFYRKICPARLDFRDLPDRWFGLESADVVLWDEPKPSELSSAQLRALMTWVRNGGKLVIGAGPAWSELQASPLAEILPVRGDGPPVEVRRLPQFAKRFASALEEIDLSAPLLVATGELRTGALPTFVESGPQGAFPLFATWQVGSGRVTMCAARLRELQELGGRLFGFYELFLDLNQTTSGFRTAETEAEGMMVATLSQKSIFGALIEPIEFRAQAGLRVVAAFAFVGVYILLATFVSWAWLTQRKQTQHAWTLFTVFALGASVVSLGAVGLMRGVRDDIRTVSVLDLQAGSPDARGHVFVGYRSPRRKFVDLALGDGDAPSFIRPLPTAERTPAQYETPMRYFADPARGTITEAPIRATLKQFDGYWTGALDGTIGGKLVADRRTGRLTPGSWLENRLPESIVGGYLLYIDPRLSERGEPPARIAGLDQRSAGAMLRNWVRVPPAVNVLAVRTPRLASGARVTNLGSTEYGQYDDEYAKWRASATEPDPVRAPILPTLYNQQIEVWGRRFGTMGGSFVPIVNPTEAAALLASTRDLYLHSSPARNFDSVGIPITTKGLSDMDVTHWLTRGQAVLLVFGDGPADASLLVDGEPQAARDGTVLYRVRIPIEYTTSAAPRENAP